MEEYPYPIVVEGDWSPEQPKRLKNKLQIYFQSKKKSQGGDCVIQFNEKSSTVTVLFKSSDIRDNVLSKEDHVLTIDNVTVKLKVSNPEDVEKEPDNSKQLTMEASFQQPKQNVPTGSKLDVKNLQESYSVVLENVSDELCKNVLALLVENVSGVPEKDFSMELIPELNTAVLTFNNPSAVGKFLEESQTHKKFHGYGWKVRALERTTCVRVENLSDEANNKMLLEMYFEKWGGPVEETIIVPLEQAAIISFTNEEDKDKVLKMEHKISNVPVKIYPYCKSLDTALYGSNRPTLKLPEPITVSVHPAIRKFLLMKSLISSISDKMSKQFCQIDMDKTEVLLSPDPALLKQKVETRRHIDCWAKNSSDTFKTIISDYTAFELPVLYPVWTKAESDIKGLLTDQVYVYMNASKGALTMAGATHDINGVKSVVGKMLDRASTQMERERTSITDDVKVTPAVHSQNTVPSGSEAEVNLQGSYAVVLDNVSVETNKDVLALLVENVSGVPEKDLSMELIPELNTAVVIFHSPSALGKFLEESKTHTKFQDYGWKARALERSKCVRVEDLSAEANNKMLLELYFEKWGGPVEETIILPLEEAAIITFNNEEDKQKVLKMKHKISNVPVKIYPFYKSLDTALYGSNRRTWKLPESFRVNIHPAIRKFLLKKSLISSISVKMSKQFCQIDMDKTEVLLSPDPALLKQKVETRRHIDCWAKNSSDTFKTIISDYTAFELPVLYPVWTKAESDIKGLLTDQVYVYMNASKGALTMAGATHDINGVKSVVGKMLDRASTQMERERTSITDDVKVTPAVHSQNTVPSGSEAEVNLQGSYAVVLDNVSVETNKDVLALLVENVSGVPEKDLSMELIPELNTAVVIFHSPSALGKFLEESKTHTKFQDYGWKARALERSKCVRVEDLSAEANNKMLLELYFEKWGGPVEETIILPLEEAAIITFNNEEDKQKVLKMKHKISNVPVKIYPFYKSLDTALYGSNRRTWKLPESFRVNIHPAIRKFLLKKSLISSISVKMSKQFCQIDMDKPEVLLSPDPALLKQKGLTRRQIDCWAKNASDAFKSIISNYTAFELPVLNPVWTKAESDIKGLVTDQVFIYMDASKGALTMAGAPHDMNGLKSVVGKMLDRASTQMERERSSVTEVMEVTPVMYSLLQQDGLQNALTASPQLHLDYDKKMNKLHLSGPQTEILTFKNWVLEKKLSMKEKPLKVDRSVLEFLRLVDCDEMSKDLFIAQGISAVYSVVNENLLLIGSTGQALSEAEKKLKMVLQSKDIIVEDRAVLALPQWQDLHKQLQSLYDTSKKRIVLINLSLQRDKVIVSGFREPVAEVSRNLEDFIEKHSKVEDSVCVKSHAVVEFMKERKSDDCQHFMKSDEVTVGFDSIRPRIKLSGERRFVQPAMSIFKKMADALYTDTLIIKKAGAKKYFKEEGRYMLSFLLKEKGFVIVLQEDHMLKEEEEDDKGKDRGSLDKFGQCCEVQMPRRAIRKEFSAFSPKMNVPHHKKPLGHGSYGHRDQGYHGQGNQGNRNQKFGDHSYDHRNVERQVLRREETDYSGFSSARYDGLTVLETTRKRLQISPSKGNIEAAMDDAIVNTISDNLDLKTGGHRLQEEFTTARILRHGISSPVTKSLQSHHHFTPKTKPLRKPAQTFGWTKELMFWDTPESPKNEEFVMVVEEMEPAVFQLCGDTPQDLNKARDMINSLILKEYVKISILDSAISNFSKEDAEMLSTMQRELSVSIKLDRKVQDPVITLEGLTRDVHTAECRIRDMIRRVERLESKRREEFTAAWLNGNVWNMHRT